MGIYYIPSAEEIRNARLSAKLTQQESAHLCMITPNSWARYERGLMKMSAPIWELFIMKVAQQSLEQQDKPRKLTVYEQRRLEKQKQQEEETKIMKQVLDGWGDEPKQESQEDLAERYKLNQLRIEKEMMITMIEEKAPRLGADARAQFPDFDNITIPLLKQHIEKLTPVYNSVKDY